MQFLKEFLLFLWQFPQSFIGFLIAKCLKTTKTEHKNVFRWQNYGGSVSLGQVIILGKTANDWIYRHETGHQKQSLYLGWLYLLVIGLPSIIWAGIRRIFKTKHGYYWFYTESWANKLAGLEVNDA